MDDITALILDDHAEFRRCFARLDDARGMDELRERWEPLAARLKIHAEAEEIIFYPHLLKRGDDAEAETDDAIRDHNKIRDAIVEAGRHPIGSDEWWKAVWEARTENSEHLAEEEDEVLPNFRRHAGQTLRAELAGQWRAFYRDHPCGSGLVFRDKDPREYIKDNS